jgi:tetratricopeptide (TPR) repeat protein/CHAT domain-containing protein
MKGARTRRRACLGAVLVAIWFTNCASLAKARLDAEIEALNQRIDELYKAGKAAEAIPIAERYLEATKKLFGPIDPTYAAALNKLAYLYQQQGRLKEAEPLYQHALAIREKALPEGHPDTAISLNNLAYLYQQQARLKEAEPLYRRALAIKEKALPEGHPGIAASLNNLGALYVEQGRLKEAEPLYQRALAIYEKSLPEGHPGIATSLNNLAYLYQQQGRLKEADPLFRRALAIREKTLPEGHPDIATSLNNLAYLYQQQGQLKEVEPLYKRALEIREKALPEGHPDIAGSLDSLALLYTEQGRLKEAEPLHKRALAIREKALPEDHPDIATSLNNLALLYQHQGRLKEAEPLYQHALAIREKALPEGHPDIAASLDNLGSLYQLQGRLKEAEQPYQRALEIREKALPEGHPDIARALNNLGALYVEQGRFKEAEPLYQRALAIQEKPLPEGHADIATSLNNLAYLYQQQGRLKEVEPLYKRALEIREKALPEGHPDIASSLGNLGVLYDKQGRFKEAEPIDKRALAIREKALPEGHPDIARALNNLGALYVEQGRLKEAGPLYKRALVIYEKALPEGHPGIAASLDNLGSLYQQQGRLKEAEPLFRRALALREKALPEGHPDIARSLGDLGLLFLLQKDWPEALTYLRRASDVFIARAAHEGAGSRGGKSEIAQYTNSFRLSLAATYRAGAADTALRDEGFQLAQYAARTEAAAALTQMAVRQAAGDDELAKHVREGQDLQRQQQAADQRLNKALGNGDRTAADTARKEIADLDESSKAIDAELAKFPKYAALANPKPLLIAQTQEQLREDEALLQISNTFPIEDIPAESFAWVVTKTKAQWVRLSLDPTEIAERVATLRCGLDDSQWGWGMGEADQKDRSARCLKLVGGVDAPQDGDPLPFRLDVAYDLYQTLLGPFEEMIKDKHLIVVADGALAALPFQVLGTRKPAISRATRSEDFRSVAWLGTRQPLSVLPSVSSLDVLRRLPKGAAGDKPYIGFGNPLLVGPDGKDRRAFAESANTCRIALTAPPARSLTASLELAGRPGNRGGPADVKEVRKLAPLPETTEELCDVAGSLGALRGDIHVGAQATKAAVKAMNTSGELARARIVHFATHALLPGNNTRIESGLVEPALVLTPPEVSRGGTALDSDDGLLMASDVAQLTLKADWVVLSACNTAGGDRLGGEALAGLARAFFYAGTRALLVSHWGVNTNAAVKLTTRAFSEMRDHPEIGRAEAIRRSMEAMIAFSGMDAHPSRWAPFVLVGEGGRAAKMR